jgi:hypothetical protein
MVMQSLSDFNIIEFSKGSVIEKGKGRQGK